MKKRPTSISVISWILIVVGSISLLTTTFMIGNPMVQELMAKSPVPIMFQYIISYVGIGNMLVSGIAMLKGKNWGRWSYAIWGALGYVFSLLTSPMRLTLIPGLIVFAIILYFLFRRTANDYFMKTEERKGALNS